MRRGLGLALCVGLLVGGAAACGDDDDGGASPEPTTTTGAAEEGAGDVGGGGGATETTVSDDPVVAANDELIAAFCDAQDAYDEALDASLANPDDAGAQDRVRELSATLGDLATQVSAEVPDFTPEQSQQLEECQGEG